MSTKEIVSNQTQKLTFNISIHVKMCLVMLLSSFSIHNRAFTGSHLNCQDLRPFLLENESLGGCSNGEASLRLNEETNLQEENRFKLSIYPPTVLENGI